MLTDTDYKAMLQRVGIEELSSMQQAALEAGRSRKDVVLLSPTGSGKTLACLLPMAEGLSPVAASLQAVVLQPSRELAEQSEGLFRQLKTGLRSMCVCGGHSVRDEVARFRDYLPQVIFATPGRLCDHMLRGNVELSEVRWLVMDEFDKCLELGFETDIRTLLRHIPAAARKWLSSATRSERIADYFSEDSALVLEYGKEGQDALSNIRQFRLQVADDADKLQALERLLRNVGRTPTIVFAATRERAVQVYNRLHTKIPAMEIYHGGMEQQQREKALFKFRSGCSRILVSTDLAARGLDITSVQTIVHYDFPQDETTYLHRCGRTARWNQTGTSYLFVTPEDEGSWPFRNFRLLPAPALDLSPQPLPPTAWEAVYIGKGKKNKISKADVLGFLCRKGALQPQEVGEIQIAAHCVYVAVSQPAVHDMLSRVREEKIKGMRTIVALMR